MKTKDKAALTAIAKSVFERYHRAKNVAVTSDGMAFITDESDLAVRNHALKNRYGKKLSITNFEREDIETEVKTAKELIAVIEGATTVEAVEAILTAEQALPQDEQRKTVLEAGAKKLASLKNDKL